MTSELRQALLRVADESPAVHVRSDLFDQAWRARRRRMAVTGAAAVAVLGLAAGTVLAVPAAKDAVPPPPSAAGVTVVDDSTGAQVVLQLAAQSARTGPAVRIRPGQYVYQRSRGFVQGVIPAYGEKGGDAPLIVLRSEDLREEWSDPQGMFPVRIRGTHLMNVRPATARDAALAKKYGTDYQRRPYTYDLPDPDNPKDNTEEEYAERKRHLAAEGPTLQAPTPEYLAGLPTDPAQLLDRVAKELGSGKKEPAGHATFKAFLSLMIDADPIMTPDLREALLRAMALIPKLDRTKGRLEIAGQAAIAIGLTSDKLRTELLFDAKTLRLVGTRVVRVVASGPVPAGTVISQSVREHAVVDKVGQRG